MDSDDVRAKLRKLSKRECEVLYWRCQGFQWKAIARKLNLSEATIFNEAQSIYEKLGLVDYDAYQRLDQLNRIFCPLHLEETKDPEACSKRASDKEKKGPKMGTLALVLADDEKGLVPVQRALVPVEKERAFAPRTKSPVPGRGCHIPEILVGALLGATLVLVLLALTGNLPWPKVEPTPKPTVVAEAPTATPTNPEPTGTSIPSATPIPSPTQTLGPTLTATLLPTSTPTVIPPTATPAPRDTAPDSELTVGMPWVQQGESLTLENVVLGKDNSWWHEFTFYVRNNTPDEILYTREDASIEMLDQSRAVRSKMHSYRTYPGNRLAPMSGVRFVVGFNTLYQFDPFSTSVRYFYIKVSNFSRIKQALWKISVPH